jgi:poly-beta-1,6-N-acetyl-D-glucosamine synthase
MIWVFWIALSLIAYTYAGYPFWLWIRSHVSPCPVLRGCNEPRVTTIMVVRNEEAALAPKIENLLSLDYPAERHDLVIVSDGSTDSTPAILKRFE